MHKLTISVNDGEYEHIKKHPKGYVRSLIQGAMGGGVEIKGGRPKNIEVPKKNIAIKKGDGLNTCKSCGSLLPFYKGKCKFC